MIKKSINIFYKLKLNGYMFDILEENYILSSIRMLFKEGEYKSIKYCLRFMEIDVKTSTNTQKLLFYWKLIDSQPQGLAIGFQTKIHIVDKLLKEEEFLLKEDSKEFFNDLLRRFYLLIMDSDEKDLSEEWGYFQAILKIPAKTSNEALQKLYSSGAINSNILSEAYLMVQTKFSTKIVIKTIQDRINNHSESLLEDALSYLKALEDNIVFSKYCCQDIITLIISLAFKTIFDSKSTSTATDNKLNVTDSNNSKMIQIKTILVLLRVNRNIITKFDKFTNLDIQMVNDKDNIIVKTIALFFLFKEKLSGFMPKKFFDESIQSFLGIFLGF